MQRIAGFEVFPVEFTKHGSPAHAEQVEEFRSAMAHGGIRASDLLVVSHGWNNDMGEAGNLYATLLQNLAGALPAGERKFAVLAVYWPSKRFADSDLIPGLDRVSRAAAGAADADLAGDRLKERIEMLTGFFDHDRPARMDELSSLVDRLDDSPTAQRLFVNALRVLVGPGEEEAVDEDGSDRFLTKDGATLFDRLAPAPRVPQLERRVGGVASVGGDHEAEPPSPEERGTAAGLGSVFSGAKAAAWRLLNYATYYQMKKRAGVVGQGLNELLAGVRALRSDLRLHLVGHSFGARVVSAAVDGPAALRPSSLVLLQGAYSHHGLTADFEPGSSGAFHSIVAGRKVGGPIAITHTKNDLAVGVAYAIASRLANDARASLGDENDRYGGIGRNGAVKLKSDQVVTAELQEPGTIYPLESGKVTNVRADAFISGHGDVTNAAVASLLASAISRAS